MTPERAMPEVAAAAVLRNSLLSMEGLPYRDGGEERVASVRPIKKDHRQGSTDGRRHAGYPDLRSCQATAKAAQMPRSARGGRPGGSGWDRRVRLGGRRDLHNLGRFLP